jgi:hypothetical protein
MAGAKCECQCGQAPYRTTRNRKAECLDCGYVIRVTRDWIAAGLPSCVCGGTFELPCLFDRSHLPGVEGAEAWQAVEGKRVMHDQRSEYAKRAIRARKRCKHESCGALLGKGELYCPTHRHHDLPF